MTIVFPVARAGAIFHENIMTFEREIRKYNYPINCKRSYGEHSLVMTLDEARIAIVLKITKLTWNNLAYDSHGFMTSVYQFFLISLINLKLWL